MARDGRSPAATGSKPGLLNSLRALAATLVGLVHTRLELLLTELEEARARISELALLALVVMFCSAMGVIMLTLLVVVIAWDSHRVLAVAVLTGLYFVAAALAASALKSKARIKPKLFAASLAELGKDRQWLKQ